jgi:glucose-6-phosphate isomerase
VFSNDFGPAAGYLTLAVLDSTDPGAVLAYADRLDPAKTLYIVSSKSGGTVETHSFFKYFYNQTAAALGAEAAGAHFVAITDPGSQLNAMAARYGFRAVFDNNPNIGGRYSALSHFGLVPAALLGVDLRTLLTRAAEAARQGAALAADNAADPAILLGLIMGELAGLGRDKVTFFISPALDGLGDWIEQLIAESTGKEGRGILPVVGEPLAAPAVYGADRLFVRISLVGEDADEAALAALEAAGHPVVHLSVAEPIDLGAHFFLWEMATAVAGYCLAHQSLRPAERRGRQEAGPPDGAGLSRAGRSAARGDGAVERCGARGVHGPGASRRLCVATGLRARQPGHRGRPANAAAGTA